MVGLDQIEARRLPGPPRHGNLEVAFAAIEHRQRHRQAKDGAVLARLRFAAELVVGRQIDGGERLLRLHQGGLGLGSLQTGFDGLDVRAHAQGVLGQGALDDGQGAVGQGADGLERQVGRLPHEQNEVALQARQRALRGGLFVHHQAFFHLGAQGVEARHVAGLIQLSGHPQQLAAQINGLARQPHTLPRQQCGPEGPQHLYPHAALGVAHLPRCLIGQRLRTSQANSSLILEFHHLRHPDLGVVGEFQSGIRRMAVAPKGRGYLEFGIVRVDLRLGDLAAGNVHAVALHCQSRIVGHRQVDCLGQCQPPILRTGAGNAQRSDKRRNHAGRGRLGHAQSLLRVRYATRPLPSRPVALLYHKRPSSQRGAVSTRAATFGFARPFRGATLPAILEPDVHSELRFRQGRLTYVSHLGICPYHTTGRGPGGARRGPGRRIGRGGGAV